MEPKTETMISSKQNQFQPSKEHLSSVMAKPRYWAAALLPIISGIAGFFIYLLLAAMSVSSSITFTLVSSLLFWILPPIFIATTSFAVNYYLPFSTNKSRLIYSSLPALIISIPLLIFISNWAINSQDYFIWAIPCAGFDLLILISFLVFFGRLGAKAGITRGRKA